MNTTRSIYQSSLSLFTDLYQVTMAYGYWKSGMAEQEAVFHLFFRKNPFGGGYAVSAGQGPVAGFLSDLRPTDSDIAYLAGLTGSDGKPLFEQAFLDYLSEMEFSCDVDAVPEGEVVFPHMPILRVKGPLLQAQLIETPLLNIVNFNTLIATKAARLVRAAKGDAVVEFGMRRAQGVDGALTVARAAYVGGAAATSNVLAGKLHGIPVIGTHAHSWVMAFDTEAEAFETYARVMPNNAIFLVDTYDTVEGVHEAVRVGKTLRERGYEMGGVRLDSGDLALLSIEARRILDEGGFPKAKIVASNDLDEYRIAELKAKGAKITVWGVGTRLATAYDQPALGGVYKLAAICEPGGEWEYRMKLSEQPVKVSNPGILQVRRFYRAGKAVADMLCSEHLTPELTQLHDLGDPERIHLLHGYDEYKDLLQPLFRKGEAIRIPDLATAREHARNALSGFSGTVLANAPVETYVTGLEPALFRMKSELMQKLQS